MQNATAIHWHLPMGDSRGISHLYRFRTGAGLSSIFDSRSQPADTLLLHPPRKNQGRRDAHNTNEERAIGPRVRRPLGCVQRVIIGQPRTAGTDEPAAHSLVTGSGELRKKARSGETTHRRALPSDPRCQASGGDAEGA